MTNIKKKKVVEIEQISKYVKNEMKFIIIF